jgi:hypothetical protein
LGYPRPAWNPRPRLPSSPTPRSGAWDREITKLTAMSLGDEIEAQILGQTAMDLFGTR